MIKVNPFPDNKILALSKVKEFADKKFNVTQNIKFVFHRVQKHCGKKKYAGYHYFLLFQQSFQKASFQGCIKKCYCVVIG